MRFPAQTLIARLAGSLRPSRRRLHAAGGLAGLTVAAVLMATAPGLTNASWIDSEWTHASVGTQTCANATEFATRGAGRFLGADLLGAPVSAIADVSGLEVTKQGTAPSVVVPAGTPPVSAAPADANTYANPLDVTALNGALAVSLDNVLELPLSASTPAGAYNEYGRAEANGYSAGASGLVSNSGAIEPTGPQDPANLPTTASFDLSTFSTDALARSGESGSNLTSLGADVTGLGLGVGEVASSAQLNGCDVVWGGGLATDLVRQYLIAGLGLKVQSPLLGQLTGDVTSTLSSLQTTLNGLTGNAGLGSAIGTGVGGLLTGALSALSVGNVTVNLTATEDFSGVTDLLDNTYHDANNVLYVDMSTGTVTVDLASLFGGINGLNNLPPNTELLVNAAVVDRLQTALLDALGQFTSQVTAALTAAINAITINGTVGVTLKALGINALSVTTTLTNVKLNALTGTGPVAGVTVAASALGAVSCPPLLDPVSILVCPLITGVGTAVTQGIPGILGGAIHGLADPLTTGLATTLHTAAGTVTSPIVQLLGDLLGGLFGPNGLASLLVNVQNDPTGGGPPPSDWAAIQAGQYDQGALRVGILGMLGAGQDVNVVFARSSVGPNTPLP